MAVVAVVNDDDGARELVARIIERDGHTAHRVESADAALTLLQAGGVNIAVFDLVTAGPAANRNLLAEVRAAMPGSPVRAVLVGRSSGAGLLAWQGGADGFLVRPFHARELVQAIDEALARPDADREAHRRAAITAIAAS